MHSIWATETNFTNTLTKNSYLGLSLPFL
jgi:hypothetical protein